MVYIGIGERYIYNGDVLVYIVNGIMKVGVGVEV